MGVKEEVKDVFAATLGAASVDKVDSFSDADPKTFLDQCKGMLAGMLGDALAQQKMDPLYAKYT